VLLIPALILLLVLNAFFVLSEFAIVKVRPTRVAELIDAGDRRALLLSRIQKQLDIYLGVCQVGITLASVALGMISAKLAERVLGQSEPTWLRYALAVGLSYVVVSGSHIVAGEQVPKSIAIRIADRAALWSVYPLRLFRVLFWPALWLLNAIAQAILRLLGLSGATDEERHSRAELRLILDHSQERGLM